MVIRLGARRMVRPSSGEQDHFTEFLRDQRMILCRQQYGSSDNLATVLQVRFDNKFAKFCFGVLGEMEGDQSSRT